MTTWVTSVLVIRQNRIAGEKDVEVDAGGYALVQTGLSLPEPTEPKL